MNAPTRPHIDYALAYARQGWRVFPLHEIRSGDCSCGRDDCSSAGKHPRPGEIWRGLVLVAAVRVWLCM